MNEKVCYERNFLKEVIIRIDFMSPLEKNKNKVTAKLNKKIMSSFSIPEIKDGIDNELVVRIVNNKPITEMKTEKTKEFHYYGKNGDKELVLSKDCLFITYKKYERFETLKADFMSIVEELFETEDIQLKRMGLRYINLIELDEDNPTGWRNYLNENLISVFAFCLDSKKIARAFSNLELTCDDFKLRFQYGMHNPDFPAPIVKKSFVLDYDAYYESLIEKTKEIDTHLEILHSEIQKMFEDSIKDPLREKMI